MFRPTVIEVCFNRARGLFRFVRSTQTPVSTILFWSSIFMCSTVKIKTSSTSTRATIKMQQENCYRIAHFVVASSKAMCAGFLLCNTTPVQILLHLYVVAPASGILLAPLFHSLVSVSKAVCYFTKLFAPNFNTPEKPNSDHCRWHLLF